MWYAIQDAYNACASVPLDQLHPASLAQLYQLPLFPSASEFLRYFAFATQTTFAWESASSTSSAGGQHDLHKLLLLLLAHRLGHHGAAIPQRAVSAVRRRQADKHPTA